MSEPPQSSDGTSIPESPATTREDADQRYRRSLDCDPFPDIPEALLNSADVYDYIRATGMVYPFDASCMKAASYEVSIGDRCIYWDDDKTLRSLILEDGQTFILHKNSIVFVVPREEFRLPHYIALRFNLRITNVHRGILLGTGPLVDPGFAGRLLIPLHNLTTNDYVFKKGEPFAWFEFTKVSPHHQWRAEYRSERSRMGLLGEYRSFPEDKKWLDPDKYFEKALLNISPKAIASSIPESMLVTERIAKKARENAKDIRNWVASLGLAGFIAILLALTAIIQGSWQLVSGIQDSVSEAEARMAEVTTRLNESLPQINRVVEALSARIAGTAGTAEELRGKVGQNTSGIVILQEEIKELRSGVKELQDSLDDIRRQPKER